MENQAYLLLEDGTVLAGKPMGRTGRTFGTVVFSTSMVGYQEALTDPANDGMLLTQTFPLIGNYGINSAGWESGSVHAAGYIVREYCEFPSNYRCEGAVNDFLKENGVVGICDIDTRHLTKLIRENGEQRGMIVSDGSFDKDACLAELNAWQPGNGVEKSTAVSNTLSAAGLPAACKVAVIDFGLTNSLKKALLERGAELAILPWNATAEQVKAVNPDGILLSDGPGDPNELADILPNLRDIAALGLPMLAISLGHQLLALANGISVSRMKVGHRGANQPVVNTATGRTYITSQNHGYVALPEDPDAFTCVVSYRNANDRSVEGFSYKTISAESVQFIPDNAKGNASTSYIYDEFLAKIQKGQVK